jgi:hypothetical protein
MDALLAHALAAFPIRPSDHPNIGWFLPVAPDLRGRGQVGGGDKAGLARAEDERIDVLCLPECFLTGYYRKPARAAGNSIDLDSARFDAILAELAGFELTLILGLIERTETGLFNSAVIIERGELVGRYRKQPSSRRRSSLGTAPRSLRRTGSGSASPAQSH